MQIRTNTAETERPFRAGTQSPPARSHPPRLSRPKRRFDRRFFSKRIFDVTISVMTLIVAFPLMVLIALLVKWDSKGPVFYRQRRVGHNRRQPKSAYLIPFSEIRQIFDLRQNQSFGRPFWVFKFRSMYVNAESKGRPVWCKEGDPRITRFGRLLRKSHLDELPQLFNIIKGEMSLVGPRPERPEFVKALKQRIPSYDERLSVLPGLTGLAQIRHRADRVIRDVRCKIRYDVLYIRHTSVFTDFRIIMGTIPFVFDPVRDFFRSSTQKEKNRVAKPTYAADS